MDYFFISLLIAFLSASCRITSVVILIPFSLKSRSTTRSR